MVKVNNIEIDVLPNDTEASFVLNVANALDTLPRFLHFKDKIDIDELKKNKKKKMEVDELLQIINGSTDEVDFGSFYDIIKEKNFPINESIRLYIIRNKVINNSMYKLLLQSSIEDVITDKIDIDNILKEKDSIERKIKGELAQNKRKINQINKINKKISSEKSKYYSPFETEKIILQLKTNISDISMIQIFDSIKTNHFIPYVNYGDYYKIFEEFKPLESYIFDIREDIIIMKLLSTKTHSSKINLEKDYEDALIYYKDNKLVIDIKTNLKILSQDELISRVLSIFQEINVKVESIEKTKFNGIFFIADISINKHVLSDLIMNNDIFENFLVINELVKTHKKKSGLYIYFNDPLRPDLGEVRANLVMKQVKVSDAELRGKDRKNFPFDSMVLRVKISSAKGIDAVEHFQNIFSKLMSLYEKEKKGIIDFYKDYIKDFGEDDIQPVKEKSKKIDLKYLAPDVFVADYASLCQVEKPSIIPDNEVKKYPADQVMRFPKSSDEGIQYHYVCNHKNKPYPGLILNTLSNRDIYPYLPCCFKKDQKLKDKSYYKAYYNDEEFEVGEQQRIITTNKLTQRDKFGVIPSNLKLLFETFEGDFCKDPDFCYLRKGVSRSKSSFLECILDAIGIKMPDNPLQRKKFIENERVKLSTLNLAICKQECFDLSIEEISNYIINQDNYFDPKLFVRLLEEKYNVNIFLFNRDFGVDVGYMILPRHVQGHFYNPKSKKNSILIYEHLGNESDKSTYPQCELITQWDGKSEKGFANIFETTSGLIRGVNKMYKMINGEYSTLNQVNKEISIKLPINMIKSQWIDEYGKVRALAIKFENKTIYTFTSPLPPFNIITTNITDFIKENDFDDLKSLIEDLNITLKFKDEDGKIIQGENGISNFTFILKENTDLDLEVKRFNIPIVKKKSILEVFDSNRQIANILVHHFIYNYSKYINENNKEILSSTIVEFSKNFIKFEKNFNYTNLSNNFSNKSVYFGNKLIIPDEETLKRLIFILRKEIEQNRSSVKGYYLLKYIPDYYLNISDFQKYPLQIILKGKNRVLEYISTPVFDNTLYHKVKIGESNPYFMELEGVLYIVQPVSSLGEGVWRGKVWKEDGFNPSGESEESDYVTEIILYESIDSIKKISKGEVDNDLDIQVLVYKKDGELYYNSLLKI